VSVDAADGPADWSTTSLAEAAGTGWVLVEPGGPAPTGQRRYVGMDGEAFETRRSATVPDDGAGVLPWPVVVGTHGWVFTDGGAFVADCSWYDDPSPAWPLPASATTPRRLDGRCALLSSEWAGENFGHFLLDLLPRLHLLERSGLLDDGVDHWLVPPIQTREARDLLARSGIDHDRIVWLEPHVSYTAPEVVVASHPGARHTTPAWVPRYARRRFTDPRPDGLGDADLPRRIYLARGNNIRRPVDERAVIDALADLGFVTIDSAARPGNALFAAAEVVVGPHAAALTNTMFCPPGATLVELAPSDHPFPFFLSSALASGLGFVGFGCPSNGSRNPDDPSPSDFDFTVDLDLLVDTVSEVVAAPDTDVDRPSTASPRRRWWRRT